MSGKRAGGSASANTGRRRAAGCSSCITSPACRVFADARAVPPAGGPGPRLPVAARQPGPTGRESCLPSAGPAAAITCRSDGAATPPGYVALPRGTQGFAGSSPGDIARHVYLLPEVIAATGQTVQAIPRGRWLAGRVSAGRGAGIGGRHQGRSAQWPAEPVDGVPGRRRADPGARRRAPSLPARAARRCPRRGGTRVCPGAPSADSG